MTDFWLSSLFRTEFSTHAENSSTHGMVRRYIVLRPSLRSVKIPLDFKTDRCLEILDIPVPVCSTISQTHFSPSLRNSIIPNLKGCPIALKTSDFSFSRPISYDKVFITKQPRTVFIAGDLAQQSEVFAISLISKTLHGKCQRFFRGFF